MGPPLASLLWTAPRCVDGVHSIRISGATPSAGWAPSLPLFLCFGVRRRVWSHCAGGYVHPWFLPRPMAIHPDRSTDVSHDLI